MDGLIPKNPAADTERHSTADLLRAAAGLICFAVIVATLYFGQEVLVPLVLAAVLAFVLAPLVRTLERLWLPRIAAVLLAVVAAFTLIGLLSLLVGQQVGALIGQVPQYEKNIVAKWQALVASHPALSRIAAPVTQGADDKSDRVLSLVEWAARPVLAPLTTAAIVLVFSLVFLLYNEDLRDRFVRLAGRRDLHRTIFAMNDAGRRLSRYFLSQLMVNAGFGLWIGAGLMLIGLPGAILVGLLAATMRFVPFVGTFIALAAATALAIAVAPGWTPVLVAVGLFLVTEILVSQVVEPLLYGHSTGLSPVAVLVAASFWTTLWGFVGLLLATPLTVVAVVMGKHVPPLAFLDIVFGSASPLLPPETFYLRALEGRSLSLVPAARTRMKADSVVDYYDREALPGLVLAQRDGAGDDVDDERLDEVHAQIESLLAALSPAGSGQDSPSEPDPEPAILCLPARSLLDDLAAEMVAQSLFATGFRVAAAPNTVLDQADPAVSLEAVQICCLSVLEIGASAAQVRFFVRLIQQKCPNAAVVIGLWGAGRDSALLAELRSEHEGEHVVLSIGELVAYLRATAGPLVSRKRNVDA